MFFTGYSRDADGVLDDQRTRTEPRRRRDDRQPDGVEELGRRIETALERATPREFAELMHEHWLRKRKRSRVISNDAIDRWYELGWRQRRAGRQARRRRRRRLPALLRRDPSRSAPRWQRPG